MLKRQNQNQTQKTEVTMYGWENYYSNPYDYGNSINGAFAYKPGMYGSDYDANMGAACDGALNLLFGWLLH